MPGLGTVLVGDDPGSQWYVGAKHKDCAEHRHRLDPARPARHAPPRPRSRRSSTSSTPTRRAPASSCSSRPGSTSSRCCRGSTPTRTSTGCTRSTSASWCSARPARCRARPSASIELLRRHGVPIAGAEVVVVGRGLTVGRPLGLLLTRRWENATVTLCHTGTRDLAGARAQRRHRGGRGRRARHHHRRHGQARRRRARRRASRGVDGKIAGDVDRRRVGGGRLGLARTPRASAR